MTIYEAMGITPETTDREIWSMAVADIAEAGDAAPNVSTWEHVQLLSQIRDNMRAARRGEQ